MSCRESVFVVEGAIRPENTSSGTSIEGVCVRYYKFVSIIEQVGEEERRKEGKRTRDEGRRKKNEENRGTGEIVGIHTIFILKGICFTRCSGIGTLFISKTSSLAAKETKEKRNIRNRKD